MNQSANCFINRYITKCVDHNSLQNQKENVLVIIIKKVLCIVRTVYCIYVYFNMHGL